MHECGKSQRTGLKLPMTSSKAVAVKEFETADTASHKLLNRLVLRSSVVQNEEYYDFEEELPREV